MNMVTAILIMVIIGSIIMAILSYRDLQNKRKNLIDTCWSIAAKAREHGNNELADKVILAIHESDVDHLAQIVQQILIEQGNEYKNAN